MKTYFLLYTSKVVSLSGRNVRILNNCVNRALCKILLQATWGVFTVLLNYCPMLYKCEKNYIGLLRKYCSTASCITVSLYLYVHCKRSCGPYVADK